jgi:uncharacterized coiled-coil protein SlyX
MRKSDDGQMSLRFIAHWEERVAKQEQLIAELKSKGRPGTQAEATLRLYRERLQALRNHAEVMSSLMEPDPYSYYKLGDKDRKSV